MLVRFRPFVLTVFLGFRPKDLGLGPKILSINIKYSGRLMSCLDKTMSLWNKTKMFLAQRAEILTGKPKNLALEAKFSGVGTKTFIIPIKNFFFSAKNILILF